MGIVMGGVGGYRGLKPGKPMVQMSTSRHGSKPDTIREERWCWRGIPGTRQHYLRIFNPPPSFHYSSLFLSTQRPVRSCLSSTSRRTNTSADIARIVTHHGCHDAEQVIRSVLEASRNRRGFLIGIEVAADEIRSVSIFVGFVGSQTRRGSSSFSFFPFLIDRLIFNWLGVLINYRRHE